MADYKSTPQYKEWLKKSSEEQPTTQELIKHMSNVAFLAGRRTGNNLYVLEQLTEQLKEPK